MTPTPPSELFFRDNGEGDAPGYEGDAFDLEEALACRHLRGLTVKRLGLLEERQARRARWEALPAEERTARRSSRSGALSLPHGALLLPPLPLRVIPSPIEIRSKDRK